MADSTTNGQSMSGHTNQYIREILHLDEAPPPIPVRYFYSSPLAIDDPLSPLPPIAASSSTARRHTPRPFSQFDNEAINNAWLKLRKDILKHNEEPGEKRTSDHRPGTPASVSLAQLNKKRDGSPVTADALAPGGREIPSLRNASRGRYSTSAETAQQRHRRDDSVGSQAVLLSSSLRPIDPLEGSPATSDTTGNPFVRVPSRGHLTTKAAQDSKTQRPLAHLADSYHWDEDMESALSTRKDKAPAQTPNTSKSGPSVKVPVGVSRLHHVVMDTVSIRMEPIYWSPVNDIADVVRGTWFYKDTMMPVEIEVANMLEVGYLDLKPWTQTWKDELNSAVEVGASGEMKIVHKLWPDRPRKPESRPTTSREMQAGTVQNTLVETVPDPESERKETVENACDLIDISTGPDGPDNKAAGDPEYVHAGQRNIYRKAGVIYASDNEAYILRPSLLPSDYYNRRPLANYIRKGRRIGICVCRGFDQAIWDRLHPTKNTPMTAKAREGVSSAQAGIDPRRRQKADPSIAESERPNVTDLVLVIHGIGQKLSERIETFHFTHAINAFRREVNVELGTPSVKSNLREDMGGIMVLPVNWRLRISLEDETMEPTEVEDPAKNKYTLKDITPSTLSTVRGIVSDVMLDIPYYLSPEHNPKMLAACIGEANRIYRLWCQNNPGFSEWGRVHLIAHSLGSVMAIDILSQQPSQVPPHLGDPSYPEDELPKDQFIFDTKSLFVCGSPVGFFLLLKNAALLPRRDKEKPGAESYATPGVAGEQGTYGCIAVDNIYNILNPYDPVAYRLNAAVDVLYADTLKPALVPSAETSWFAFSNPFRSTPPSSSAFSHRNTLNRLPSNVELETHNFTREEIAEKRAYLLNDNGQIDWFMKYGGGPLEIQYLTMLGAHSSYWISRDFVRMIVVEVGRAFGRSGTVEAMRAVKRKMAGVQSG